MKKEVIILGIFILLSLPLIAAQSAKIEVSTLKEAYLAGENITIRVSLLDSSNSPINTEVNLIFEDVERRTKIGEIITSNKIEEINLGDNVPSGFWNLIANYEENKATTSFLIESEELVDFSINNNILTITNIGNIKYSKTVQIIIGDIVGIKKPTLEIGESIEFRLIAPEGDYNIRITDGTSSLTLGNVALTGEVIGVLDERINNRRIGITGTGPSNTSSSYSFVKQNPFVYFFVLAIVGAMVLLTIERHYRKRYKSIAK